MAKITLLIPTLNEIEAVKVILPKIDRSWVDEILIIDGHSTDGTQEYLSENNYKVVLQKLPGSRNAWWEGFCLADGDTIILFSPDGNSVPEKIPELVAKINEGYDMVIASRYKDGAKSLDDDIFSGCANALFNKIINFLFKSDYTDALVMYRIFKKDILKKLNFTQDTGLELNKYKVGLFELIISIRCAKYKLKTAEIPADEPPNIGRTESRAHPGLTKFYNGFLMLYHVVKEFRTPLQ